MRPTWNVVSLHRDLLRGAKALDRRALVSGSYARASRYTRLAGIYRDAARDLARRPSPVMVDEAMWLLGIRE